MIKLVDSRNSSFWINPTCIRTIENHIDSSGSVIAYEIGSSCCHIHMVESADAVHKMIEEAKLDAAYREHEELIKKLRS